MRKLALKCFAAVLFCSAVAFAGGVEGQWTVAETGDTGGPATATITFKSLGSDNYSALFEYSDHKENGVCTADDSVVVCGWSEGTSFGINEYELKEEGGKATLSGKWLGATQEGKTGSEIATKDGAGVEGSYQVAGKSPAGGDYTGTLKVAKGKNEYYTLEWQIGDKKSTGVGYMTQGGSLLAAWGDPDGKYGLEYMPLDGSEGDWVWANMSGGKAKLTKK